MLLAELKRRKEAIDGKVIPRLDKAVDGFNRWAKVTGFDMSAPCVQIFDELTVHVGICNLLLPAVDVKDPATDVYMGQLGNLHRRLKLRSYAFTSRSCKLEEAPKAKAKLFVATGMDWTYKQFSETVEPTRRLIKEQAAKLEACLITLSPLLEVWDTTEIRKRLVHDAETNIAQHAFHKQLNATKALLQRWAASAKIPKAKAFQPSKDCFAVLDRSATQVAVVEPGAWW